MTREEMLNEVAGLVAGDPTFIDEVKKQAEKKRSDNIETKAKDLPKIKLSTAEFTAIVDYVKAGARVSEPFKLVEEIENAIDAKDDRKMILGMVDLFATSRASMYSTLVEMKKRSKVAELQQLAHDILDGKVPA